MSWRTWTHAGMKVEQYMKMQVQPRSPHPLGFYERRSKIPSPGCGVEVK